MYKLLKDSMEPKIIRSMSVKQLNILSNDIRKFLIDKVSKTGGHLASNLGVVELTLSLFKVFNFDKDKIIWDVGHQSYVHKIITGRKDEFDNLREYGGISGFPKMEESKYDMFNTGHSSTSISAGLGMAHARDLSKKNYNIISVIGDGALTGGMAFEALNDIGYNKTKIIIILNDNQMSIAKNVGGMSTYLSRIRLAPKYNKIKGEVKSVLKRTSFGKGIANSIEKLKDGIKQIVVPGMFFEEIGIKYLGPIDGHDIQRLSEVFSLAKNIDSPVIIHVITQKGKGYKFAESNPGKFHGIGPFDLQSGEVAVTSNKTYSHAFGNAIVELAKEDEKIVAVTAAMPDGTGLKDFASKFKERFFDVGIAEQHAVTMAAGMASQGLKPIFAVYSTFLQRSYDQILHDVCLQKLPVVFAIDRAGIVGKDGETHQGIFDISFLSHIPNMTIMAPKCVNELKPMLSWAVKSNSPVGIRYPRGCDILDEEELKPINDFSKGKWETVSNGENIAIIATGRMVQHAMLAKKELLKSEVNPKIINACFIKPIDKDLIKDLVNKKYKIITIEDNVIYGGMGSLILEYINELNYKGTVLNLGYKDKFIPHGNVNKLYEVFNIDVDGIVKSVLSLL